MTLTEVKIRIYDKCTEITAQRIFDIKKAIQEVQEAANNETKSSAGDKHETGRAMAQLETEKLTTQLAEALKSEQVLNQINPKTAYKQVALGSLIITNNGNFYITISLGKLEINHQTYFIISSVSPIGKQLIGLKEKDSFSFNERKYRIEKVG